MTNSAAAKPAGAQLRISNARVWAYGGALVAIGLCTVLIANTWQTDWIILRSAGALAGTKRLLDASNSTTPFVYPPGVAWFFVPAARLPVAVGFYLNSVLMLCACAGAAIIATRVYGLRLPLAMLLVFAWAPATQAGFLGQFTPVALVLSLLAVLGLVKRNHVLAGASIGLLLYKPPDATAFVILLLARKEWRALAIVALVAGAWYVAGVLATGSDWQWPTLYFQVIRHY
ncbi:MAG TPA: glycosyltransferase family 87 protein, partial [Candidatus Cybelea sp.]